MKIEWQTVVKDFAQNGALRDLYIFGTTLSDWQCVLDTIHSVATGIEYHCDEHIGLIPPASELFKKGESGSLLRFRVGNIDFSCHFFRTADIEFDFWPNALSSQVDLDDFLGFVRLLGDSVGKSVIVCHENCPETAFLRYEPANHSLVFIPPPPL